MRALVLALLAGCVPHYTSPPDSGDTGDAWVWVPPDNDWPMSAPPEGLEGTGFDEGEVLPDFRLPDQYDQTVALWQFYGMVLVVDISTMWCGPCQNLAEDAEATYQDVAPGPH